MRVFTIISGFEITNLMQHFVASGYTTPQQMLNDLESTKQLVLRHFQQDPQQKIMSEKFDVDAFLDAINREKNSGQPPVS